MDTTNTTAAAVAALNQEIALVQGRVDSNTEHIKVLIARMLTACFNVRDAAEQGYMCDAGHVMNIAGQIQQAQEEVKRQLNNIAQLNYVLDRMPAIIYEPATDNN